MTTNQKKQEEEVGLRCRKTEEQLSRDRGSEVRCVYGDRKDHRKDVRTTHDYY